MVRSSPGAKFHLSDLKENSVKRFASALLISAGVMFAGPVHATFADNCTGHGNQANCEIPEAPYSIGLPLAGMVVLGGYMAWKRRGTLQDDGEED